MHIILTHIHSKWFTSTSALDFSAGKCFVKKPLIYSGLKVFTAFKLSPCYNLRKGITTVGAIKKKTFTYNGLGFPIRLIDVPMKKMFGDWVIDVDMTELQLVVLRALVYKPVRLTKEELKFIRHFLIMTTTEFGKIFGVRHSAVVQWENGTRNLSPSIELCIRLYVFNNLHVKDKEFRSLYNQISIEQLSKKSEEELPPLEIDASEELRIA